MKTAFFSLRIVAPLLAFALALLGPLRVYAEGPKVYLWGFVRGCEPLADMDRLVEKKLFGEGKNVALLARQGGQNLPACVGESCAKAFQAACPAAPGRVLGGQILQGKDIIQSRLWLYDLSTGQTAYQDDFCQSCNLLSALSTQARALLEHPQFGATPGPAPSYCAMPPAAQAVKGPVLLAVFGNADRHKSAALQAALKAQLEALDRPPLPIPADIRSFDRDTLERLVAPQQNARVLLAELQRDGKVTLSLYDQRSKLTDNRSLSCRDCDGEALSVQVKQVVSELLDRCIGPQCAAFLAAPAPPDACQPYPQDACASPAALPSAGAGPSPSARYIDPHTAKLLLGISWGAVAATALSGVLLRAISGTSAGDYQDRNGAITHNFLDGPGYAVLGAAAGLMVGVAIPTTILVGRASSHRRPSASEQSAHSLFQCPN